MPRTGRLPAATVRPPPRAKRLVYMGSFIRYKNVATLARAAVALLPDYTST